MSRAGTHVARSRRSDEVSDGLNEASYEYVAHSPLVGNIALARNQQPVMTTSRQYDNLNRMTRIEALNAQSAPLNSWTYECNAVNQRTAVTNADGCYWIYGYDRLGQVTSGKKHWPGGQVVAGEQFEYVFDDIGNRKLVKTGGDAFGQSLRTASYTPTLLNQITQRVVTPFVDVLGYANSAATVTVNNQAVLRRGEWFRAELGLTNADGPAALDLTTLAVLRQGTNGDLTATNTGRVLAPRTPETFVHEADGNLAQDGLWDYTWDGENRLTWMISRSEVPERSRRWLEFRYDDQGRRISKTVSNRVSGSWSFLTDHRFVYDGWNLLAVVGPDLQPLMTFAWGLGLSGTPQGAGGVGGLLWVTILPQSTNESATFFACSDGNGNVTELVGVSGTTTARYEYAPFGEVLRASETGGFLNPVRFASKYHDTETGLVYYGLRYYRPSTGTWASRDPAGDTRTAARSASLSAFRAFRGLARTSCVCKGEMLSH